MTALSSLTDALKRELAVPGDFADTFPDAQDADLVGYLADAFGEAQLWGFFPTVSLTASGADFDTSPDLSLAGQALVLIFAATRILRSQLRAVNSAATYKAGPVEYSVEKASNLLKGELDYLRQRLQDLLKDAKAGARASAGTVFVFDNYLGRTGMSLSLGGFYNYEIDQTNLRDFYAYPMGTP